MQRFTSKENKWEIKNIMGKLSFGHRLLFKCFVLLDIQGAGGGEVSG
jgi:hypothetical protein